MCVWLYTTTTPSTATVRAGATHFFPLQLGVLLYCHMDVMDGKSSSGACSIADVIFLPIENKLGGHPAKTACCCGCQLRTGVLHMGWPIALASLVEGVAFLFVIEGVWLIGVVQLCVFVVFSYGLYHFFQRNLKGARCIARFCMVASLCLLLTVLTIPIWVRAICRGGSDTAEANDRADCAVMEAPACSTSDASTFEGGVQYLECVVDASNSTCVANPVRAYFHAPCYPVSSSLICRLLSPQLRLGNRSASCIWMLPSSS